MIKELDRVESPAGLAMVVGFPQDGLVEVRCGDKSLYIFPEKDLTPSPGPIVFRKRTPPKILKLAEPHVVADDLDKPLVDVVQAAEYRAYQLHQKEQDRHQDATAWLQALEE